MSFYVTLPSNGSMDIYKNNKQSNYSNKLSIPLTLTSNYEVALVGISYFEYIKVNMGKISFTNALDYNELLSLEVYVFESEPIEHFVQRINKAIDEKIVQKLYTQSNLKNSDFDKITEQTIKTNLKDKKRLNFEVKKNKLYMIVPENQFVKIEGDLLINYFDIGEKTSYNGLVEIEIKILSLYKQINIINVMYVYTDIIEDQIVGDQLVPLLRNIITHKKFNHPVSHEFENPHYVRVNKSFISSINIDIRDTLGNNIQFSEKYSQVICKLHFRVKNELL